MASILSAGTTSATAMVHTADTSGVLQLATNNGTVAVTLDTAQNMGLGVTPSAWNSAYKVLQMGTEGASVSGRTDAGSNHLTLTSNTYRTSGGAWNYYNTAAAARYEMVSGTHTWFNAPSGTSGTAITFTQAMTLDASGRLGIGQTSPTYALEILNSSSPQIRQTRAIVIDAPRTLGALIGSGYSTGTTIVESAQIAFVSDTSWSSTSAPSYMSFSTTASGSITPTERARIDSSGYFLVGTTSSGSHAFFSSTAQGSRAFQIATSQYGGQNIIQVYGVTSEAGINAGGTALGVSKNGGTSRSINAAGTINASGADYAEYMTKAGDFAVAKGDVVGINADGKLTNVFADAVTFAVKSTDPSYVGGDTWGTEESIGLSKPDNNATQEEKDAFDAALEAARQMVDRIAFSGQVPVNVTGATAGQFIIPVNDNGAIKGEAVSNPTLEQYQQAVGKVIAIEQDGRARIIVKVA